MNDKKIAFILCVNDDEWMSECALYIQRLEKPQDMEIEVLAVKDAASMAAGYNEGMQSTDAKYKVYMHQDVFIINRSFIYELLKIFEKDEDIGMIGMVGAAKMSQDGVMWHSQRYGNLHDLPILQKQFKISPILGIEEEYMEMEVVDGLLMATQYDIPWREDIFDKWDFYDASQSFEFRKRGYKIVVPGQKEAWCIHECGRVSMWDYNLERMKFVEAYADMLGLDEGNKREG